MKFVDTEETADMGLRLYWLQTRRAQLMSMLKDVRREEEAVTASLQKAIGRNLTKTGITTRAVQLADPERWILELTFADHMRQDVDLDKVRAVFARLNKRLPMKDTTWTSVHVDYVYEDQDELAVNKPAPARSALRVVK